MQIDTNVTLRILGSDLDPEAVAREMGMDADNAHRKGDVHGTRRPVVRKQGYWSITSSNHIGAAVDSNEHIQWLVAHVTPKLEQLSIYRGRGWTVDVWVGIHTSAGHGGPTIRAQVLAQLASLGLDVH